MKVSFTPMKGKENELDRIYRMDRIFFAFPEERQKASPLFRASFFPRKQDYTFTHSSGKNENKNLKNPVDPV